MKSIVETILAGQKDTVNAILEMLHLFSEDGQQLDQYIDGLLAKHNILNTDEGKKNRLKYGAFGTLDFTMMLVDYQALKPELNIANSETVINGVMSQLHKFLIVGDSIPPFHEQYQLNRPRFKLFLEKGLLDNIVYGRNYMLNKYANSIPMVEVKDALDELHAGTGALFKLERGGDIKSFVLTNKHVVQGNEITLIQANDMEFHICGDIVCDEKLDLAAIPVTTIETVYTFMFNYDLELLHPIIALGYPYIPATRGRSLMAHQGEFNGVVDGIDGNEYMAISCHVSPGNSGGPLLDSIGACVGLVTQSTMGNRLNDATEITTETVYNLAISAVDMNEFFEKL